MKIPKHIENYISRYGEINRRFVVSGLRAQIDQIVIIPALAAKLNSIFDTLASLSQNPPEDMNRTADRLCDQPSHGLLEGYILVRGAYKGCSGRRRGIRVGFETVRSKA